MTNWSVRSAPRNHIGMGAASIRPTSAAKSPVARAAAARRRAISLWLSVKSNTHTSAAPPGETCGSASVPYSARERCEPGRLIAMRKGAADFWVVWILPQSWSICACESPPALGLPAGAASSERYLGMLARPSIRASLSGASIRPSTRTSSGSAGATSSRVCIRLTLVRSAFARRALRLARNTTTPAPTAQAARTSAISTSESGERSIAQPLCARARECNG